MFGHFKPTSPQGKLLNAATLGNMEFNSLIMQKETLGHSLISYVRCVPKPVRELEVR